MAAIDAAKPRQRLTPCCDPSCLFFGAIFSWVVTGVFFAALTVGGIFWIYSRDLPSHETLAQYSPKTISRIYSAKAS